VGASSVATGTKFQDDFQARWKALGKKAWLHRFADASDLYGLNKGHVIVEAQPCDYLCGFSGVVALIEAKATGDTKGFKRSLLRRPQIAAILTSIVAGTPHYVAVRNENTQEVFLIPAAFVYSCAGTVAWSDLAQFKWQDGPPWKTTLM
jgi:hypothetical protein